MSLKNEYFCGSCGITQPISNSTLKSCTRCGIVKYCNRDCQKRDFPTHKNLCLVVKRMQDGVASAINNLPDFSDTSFAACGASMMSAQHLFQMGKLYFQIAEDTSSYLIYEKAAKVFEEIMDLNAGSQMFIFEYLLFIYLNLGKYKEANDLQNRREGMICPPNLHLKIFNEDDKGPVKHGSAFYLSRFAMWLKKYYDLRASKSPTEFEDFCQALKECDPKSPQFTLGDMPYKETTKEGKTGKKGNKDKEPLEKIKYYLDLDVNEAKRMATRYFHVLDTKMEVVKGNEMTAFKKLQLANKRKLDLSDFGFGPIQDPYKMADPDFMMFLGFGYFQRHEHFANFAEEYYNTFK